MTLSSESNNLSDLVTSFFKTIGSSVHTEGVTLVVMQVSEFIEKFFGKKGPYRFVFSDEDLQKDPKAELILPGSFLLNAISEYLEKRGNFSLLELQFPEEPKQIIGDNFSLYESSIFRIDQSKMYDSIVECNFVTTFRYLHKTEQIAHTIYVHDGSVIENFEPEKYTKIAGKKQHIGGVNLSNYTSIAQEKVKEKLNEKKISVRTDISKQLAFEQERIQHHFSQQEKEQKESLEKVQSQIKDLTEKKSTLEPRNFEERHSRLTHMREKIEEEIKTQTQDSEKTRLFEQERQKHTLSIETKLLNTTIYYYPISQLVVTIKNKESAMRQITTTYNPLTKKIDPVFCDSCKKEITKLILCGSGHLTCEQCADRCRNCNRISCRLCRRSTCSQCNRENCSKCAQKCSSCGGILCATHAKRESRTQQIVCQKCAQKCARCESYTLHKYLTSCTKCSAKVCPSCATQNVGQRGLIALCSSCARLHR